MKVLVKVYKDLYSSLGIFISFPQRHFLIKLDSFPGNENHGIISSNCLAYTHHTTYAKIQVIWFKFKF